jgi:phosphoribosylamine---glycine ligase
MRAAVIGKDGRTSAIVEALRQSKRIVGPVEVLSGWKFSPFHSSREEEVRLNLQRLERSNQTPDFVVCGPEEPLATGEEGVVKWLRREFGIPCIGPTKALAQIESSKSFTRQLLAKYGIAGNPRFRIFSDLRGIESYLKELGSFVVKPDGLTGGKGVKVSGEHLDSIKEAVLYCQEVFDEGHPSIVIEEKLDGEEFSLQSFCDGTHVVDMPVVQDHKRAFPDDTGPNTGGMGSYSCEDHSLPFLSPDDIRQASLTNKLVAKALLEETGEPYKGILYGGFMLTRDGVRLIEYNARFGDPESLNVLSLLRTDFAEICEAIIQGTLHKLQIKFAKLATVCKYVVPQGYPEQPVKNEVIDLSKVPKDSEKLRTFLAAIDKGDDGRYRLSGSRAVAFVGIGKNVAEAERIAEHAASVVRGPVYHREDIGTQKPIKKRISHMRTLLSEDEDIVFAHEPHEPVARTGALKLVGEKRGDGDFLLRRD